MANLPCRRCCAIGAVKQHFVRQEHTSERIEGSDVSKAAFLEELDELSLVAIIGANMLMRRL